MFLVVASRASSRPQSHLRRIPTPYPKEMKHRLDHMRNLALKQLNLPLAADAALGASEDGASAAVSRVRASPGLVVGVSATLGASEDGASAAVSRVRASPGLVVGVSATLGASEDGASAAVSRVRASPGLVVGVSATLGASEDGASAAVSRVRASPGLVVGVSATLGAREDGASAAVSRVRASPRLGRFRLLPWVSRETAENIEVSPGGHLGSPSSQPLGRYEYSARMAACVMLNFIVKQCRIKTCRMQIPIIHYSVFIQIRL